MAALRVDNGDAVGREWTHPAYMVWDLAGRPEPSDPPRGEAVCALCAATTIVHARIGPNFTDFRTLVRRDVIDLCAPCTWVMSGKPPRTLRMWTVVARVDKPAPPSQPNAYISGEYLHLTNRKDMRWAASTLAEPPTSGPWLVAVAESGHKHTVPFTPVNHGGGKWTVRLDGGDITSTPDEWRHVLARTAALRAAGFSATAIETGQPPIAALTKDTLDVWRTHAPHLEPYTGTPLLHLANLMITKETLGDYIHTYPI